MIARARKAITSPPTTTTRKAGTRALPCAARAVSRLELSPRSRRFRACSQLTVSVHTATAAVGTGCTYGSISLTELPLERGYFRLSRGTVDVRRCPDAAANCSGRSHCAESTSGCKGGDGAVCMPGLNGTFCMLKRIKHSACCAVIQTPRYCYCMSKMCLLSVFRSTVHGAISLLFARHHGSGRTLRVMCQHFIFKGHDPCHDHLQLHARFGCAWLFGGQAAICDQGEVVGALPRCSVCL
jgi:hypothetical protein